MDQIEGILKLIKDDDLERLGKLNEVDKRNTKLLGKIIFKGSNEVDINGAENKS